MRHDLESCIMDFTEGCAHAWNILQIPQSSDKQDFIKLRGRGSSALSHPGKNKIQVGIMQPHLILLFQLPRESDHCDLME